MAAEIIVNSANFAGLQDDGGDPTDTRNAINTAINQANTNGHPNLILRFPPGLYGIDGPLTPATPIGESPYSIIMEPGARFVYGGPKNTTMWRIGSPDPGLPTSNGFGLTHFALAAESTAGSYGSFDHTNSAFIAFEIVNISHYTAHIKQGNGFATALKLTAIGTGGTRYHFDASIELGNLSDCNQPIVMYTQDNGSWMNNIRFNGGRCNQGSGVVGAIPIRYIQLITGTGGGECKATWRGPVFDGTKESVDHAEGLTYIYADGGSISVYDAHVEDPDYLIKHVARGAASFGGEPCIFISPRLENKAFRVSDPDDLGSYGHDPMWGIAATARPKSIQALGNPYTISPGDIRRSALLYTEATSKTVNVPNLGGNAAPPPMPVVYLQRREAGDLTVGAASGATLRVPTGKLPKLRAQWSIAAVQFQPDVYGNPPVSDSEPTWVLLGDLADA